MAEFSQDLFDKICDRIANGETLRKICAEDGMPARVNFWRWVRDNEELRNHSVRAREEGTHNLVEESLEIADRDDLEPADKRVRIDTRLRIAGKWNARAYGDRVDHVSSDGTMTPKEPQVSAIDLLAERLEAIAKRSTEAGGAE